MRKQLKNNKIRMTFTAEFGRWGSKKGWNGYEQPTVCFYNVRFTTGEIATDHIWFTVGKRISDLNLKPGLKIKFDARVKSYTKGYYTESQSTDYKLSNPSKISII